MTGLGEFALLRTPAPRSGRIGIRQAFLRCRSQSISAARRSEMRFYDGPGEKGLR